MKPTILFLSLLALVSCKEDSKISSSQETKVPSSTGTAPTTPPAAAPLSDILLPAAPANPVSINEARKDPTPGKDITISGDIIGRDTVFVPNRAMLILGDPDVITSCNRNAADGCKTPWDVCCDDPDVVTASIATIQVVDDDGHLHKSGLKGLGGMKELSQLVVQGTIAEGSGPDNLIVNATGIHIASVEPRK